jgi:signal transduction histidine kinase
VMDGRGPASVASSGPGDHLCCLFDSEEEHRAVLTEVLGRGLEAGDKILYLAHERTADSVLGYLRDKGFDADAEAARGRIEIRSTNDAYISAGGFDPEGTISLLSEETDRAVAGGYRALRVTGEMTWALKGLPGSERLIEYESKLNHFFPGSRCLALCQYDRRRFTPEVLLSVIDTHPIVILGAEAFDNHYFVHPHTELAPDEARATLDSRLDSLRERKRMESFRENFIAHAAHDIRTPITTLVGAAKVLARKGREISAEDHETLARLLERQADRLASLVNDVLDFTRLQQGRDEARLVEVVVPDIVVRALEGAPPPEHLVVEMHQGEHMRAIADPEFLDRALTNLLRNAYRHGRRLVRIAGTRASGRVTIEIEDDGPGISKDLVPRLFEPFVRGEYAGPTGSGLGLAIARSLVEACGGEVRHIEGRAGACFAIDLSASTQPTGG